MSNSNFKDSRYRSNTIFDAGFTNVTSNMLDAFKPYEEFLSIFGYYPYKNEYINTQDDRLTSRISITDTGLFNLKTCRYDLNHPQYQIIFSRNFNKIENHVLKLYDDIGIDIFSSIILTSKENVPYIIEAKKKLSDDLIRVKSSNIWSYGINIKDAKLKKGDVIVQFKDAHGGPGDLYQYMDVPITVWRKWVATTSKGHFLWQYIRNNYKYRKLTGDKKGKLPNALN